MTMDYAGRPAGARAIQEFAKKRGIAVLEDAALGVGLLDDGAWPGTRADVAVYSFYATKNATTGEGGMLVTNDDGFAKRVRILSLHGMDADAWKRYTHGGSWRYDVVETGYKYNMPDSAAALGIVQLRRLDELQRSRHAIAQQYDEGLRGIDGIVPAARGKMMPSDRHSFCMYVVAVDERKAGISRDRLIDELKAANIGASVHYIPSHLFSAYRDEPHGPLPVTEAAWLTLLSLPLFPTMTDVDVRDVIDALKAAVDTAHASQAARPPLRA
jgi:perosamine synthetase